MGVISSGFFSSITRGFISEGFPGWMPPNGGTFNAESLFRRGAYLSSAGF